MKRHKKTTHITTSKGQKQVEFWTGHDLWTKLRNEKNTVDYAML